MIPDYKIVSVQGHYNVFINGKFYCSADTYYEAESEIKEYINEME